MKNIVIFVMDSVGWEQISKAKIPNIRSLGELVKAYSWGTQTIPSIYSMLYGNLPTSMNGKKTTNLWDEFVNEGIIKIQFLGSGRFDKAREGYLKAFNRYLLTSNPLPFLNCAGDMFDVKVLGGDTPHLISHFKDRLKEPFYAFFLITECHVPFLGKSSTEEGQIESIEYLDKQIKILWDILPKNTKLIITSDHSNIWRNGFYVGHDQRKLKPSDLLKLLEVFIVEADK